MTRINVLLENFTINENYVPKHGFSLLIDHNNTGILLDVGPDGKFIKNAKSMNADLSKAEYLFLSHAHHDHTGGLNEFIEINTAARIYLMDSIHSKYYAKNQSSHISIGLNVKEENYSRIIQLNDDLVIDNKIFFLKNTVSDYIKPTFNKVLFKEDNGELVNDTFDHEGILVLEDNNELHIFNSCSHNGILNIIKTVKTKFPGKTIKTYVGGLHLCNPATKEQESADYLDSLTEEIKKMNIIIYTGHCTGKYAIDYMKEKLGKTIQEINTGMILDL